MNCSLYFLDIHLSDCAMLYMKTCEEKYRMNILIIGGTGTISHYVTEKYRDMGHSVTVINRGKRKYLNTENVEYITGDANHKESLLEKVKNRTFDKVIDFTTFDKETMQIQNTIRRIFSATLI